MAHMKVQLKSGCVGNVKVEKFRITKHQASMSATRDGHRYCPAGWYTKLTLDGQMVMSDTRWEIITNFEAIAKANGHVLIAGLGLGLILKPILKKGGVTSVLVVECIPDVIKLISPQYSSRKLTVVQGNIFSWAPKDGQKFDTIWFDVWGQMSFDNLPEMARLHQRFKFRLNRENPNCWMGSWCQDYLRDEKRRYER